MVVCSFCRRVGLGSLVSVHSYVLPASAAALLHSYGCLSSAVAPLGVYLLKDGEQFIPYALQTAKPRDVLILGLYPGGACIPLDVVVALMRGGGQAGVDRLADGGVRGLQLSYKLGLGWSR